MKDDLKNKRNAYEDACLRKLRRFYARDLPASPEVVEAVEGAAQVLHGLGASVTEVEVAPLRAFCGLRLKPATDSDIKPAAVPGSSVLLVQSLARSSATYTA